MEICTCETKSEAFIREQYYIDKLQPELNSLRAHTTREERRFQCIEYKVKNKEQILEQGKQYRLDTSEHILERSKQFYIANKERIKKRFAEKLYCQPCGLYHNRGTKSKHYKTQNHVKILAKVIDE